MLKKDKPWDWIPNCQEAFDELKKKLSTFLILRQTNFNNKFILYTDASRIALKAVLSQVDPQNSEYVCANASRTLQGAEKSYPVHELECLALVWAIKQFREYLYGVKFEVVTDHCSLTWLFKLKDPNARLLRWVVYLQIFDFIIIYRKGKNHSNVDAISRPVYSAKKYVGKLIEPYENEALMHYLKYKTHLAGRSTKQVLEIEKLKDIYDLDSEGNVIFLKNENWLIIPKRNKRREIIEEAHHWGHFQTESTSERISKKFIWPKLREDVALFIKSCNECQRNHLGKTFDHPAKAIRVSEICERVHVDLVFGLPRSAEGFSGILILIEALSKFPMAYPIRSKNSQEIARCLFDYISIFGPPKTIFSDQGNEFKGVVEKMLKITGIDHVVTAAYNPRCNGLVERFNQTLIESLRKYC